MEYKSLEIAEEKEQIKRNTQEITILRFKEVLNQANAEISRAIQAIQANSNKYMEIAKALNLDWGVTVSPEDMVELQKQIQDSISRIEYELDKDKEFAEKEEYIKQKNFIGNHVVLIRKVSDKYGDSNCMEQIGLELDSKVEGFIKKSRIQDYNEEIEQLQSQKIGVLGRLLGKHKQQELNIQHLSLKRRLLELEPIESKQETGIAQIYAKIAYYQIQKNRDVSDELVNVMHQMEKVFDIDRREVARLVAEKSQEKSLIQVGINEPIASKRKTLKEYNERLLEEVEEIEQNHNVNFRIQNTYAEKTTDIPGRVYEVMKRINECLTNGKEQNRSYEQE